MMVERIFNIFMYFDANLASEFGVRHHRVDGSDEEKSAFLLSQILTDQIIARRFKLKRTFSGEEWRAALRHGNSLEYFEEALKEFRAPESPVFCITPIVDGLPMVDQQIGPEPFRGKIVSEIEGHGAMPDYLVHYVDGNSFRFTDLIDDDYFKAIRMLFNAQLYVSCAKLLMSCVDTLAFVEYGDESGNFIDWLDNYSDLASLNINSNELWEFRNSVLHMTNLASRKVISGKVSSIMLYVGGSDTMSPITPDLPKPFNLNTLIKVIAGGIAKWGDTYNYDQNKYLKFIERYDTTISDSRMVSYQ